MHVTTKNLSDTKVKLTLIADAELLQAEKEKTLKAFAETVKIQGFREGKAPLNMVEKHVEPARLQSEFLERAVNRLYLAALDHENLRPVDKPQIKINKFVAFDTLELEAEVEIVGEVKLADYKKIKLVKEKVSVDKEEVDEVIKNLLVRDAEKKDVERAAKDGDEAWIDFTGVDAKTKEPIKGADGKDYPLLLGSNTFIPGFETNLVGLKAGEVKIFVLTFPKEYGVKALQNRKVEFTVTVTKVQEVVEPTLDDKFAAKVGPFKTVADLKGDIGKELLARKESNAEQKYTDDLITKIAEKSKVAIPEVLINEQIDRLEQDERQNLMYRGQTWKEFLEASGLTEESYRESQRPAAELRVKAGLVLSEIAELENLEVTPEELDAQIEALKARYSDAQMQAELAKPEGRRAIASRILTDKTVAKIKEYTAA
jgi:trigger factor